MRKNLNVASHKDCYSVHPISLPDKELNMTKNLNQESFIAANLAAMEHFQSVAASALNAFESLAALNLSVVRENCDHAATNGKALLSAKTPQEVATLTVESVKPTAEKAAAYSKQVYEISNGAAQEISSLFQNQFSQVQRTFKDAAEAMIKSSPFGSDVALAAMNQAEAAANKAYGNLTDAMNKAKAIAEGNMAQLAKASKPAARKAAK